MLSPSKTAPLSPAKTPMVAANPPTTPLENIHLAKIKELEAQIEKLTESVTTATAAAEQSAASEAEWRSKALETEAKISHYIAIEAKEANSQRSKLIEELKNESILWRRRFDELLEEHSALQSRLESTTAQVSLLDKALSTVRGDTADAIAALETAEALVNKNNEEFEAYKKEKEALMAEAVKTAAARKEKEMEILISENKRLSEQIVSLNKKIESLSLLLENKPSVEEKAKAITPVQAPAPAEEECHLDQLKERDLNRTSQISDHCTVEKAIKENNNNATLSGSLANHLVTYSKEEETPLSVVGAVQPPPPPLLELQSGRQRQGHPPSHFDAAKALIARTSELEDSLMTFNIERSSLETELAKFPSGTAGRTVAERKRKKEIEERVQVLNKEISGVRFELRKLGVR